MKTLQIALVIGVLLFVTSMNAQSLSIGTKTLTVEQFPEYIVINCDNNTTIFTSSIRIEIQAISSEFSKILKELENVLEESMKITNPTDLLNTLSKLGFDFVNAFPQNIKDNSSLSRTGFVFRKKEKYRN